MPQLLPNTFLNNTTQLYLPQVQPRAMVLYGMVLLSVVGAAIAAFFVKVDVSFTAAGMVRSKHEKTEIHSPVNGRVMSVWVHENQAVRTGDTLLTLASDVLDEKIRQVRYQEAQHGQLVTDLTFLTNPNQDMSEALGNASFRTSLYAQQYNHLQAQLEENEIRSHKVAKELKTDTYLHSEKVLATRELDAKQAEYDQLQKEHRLLIERQVSLWEADLNTHRLTLNQLKTEEMQLRKERALYTLRATVSGTVQQWAGKYEGSFVQAGEALGVLSPDSSLLAECYVKPSDMGLLKLGQAVLFQMDALNYREWGLAKGIVVDIAKDFTVSATSSTLPSGDAYFRVKCRLETAGLKLQNGYKAHLQKGMTLQARFVVTRRTLAQLLFDKTEDWLNPNQIDTKK